MPVFDIDKAKRLCFSSTIGKAGLRRLALDALADIERLREIIAHVPVTAESQAALRDAAAAQEQP